MPLDATDAAVEFSKMLLEYPRLVWCVIQSPVVLIGLMMIMPGVTPKLWLMVLRLLSPL